MALSIGKYTEVLVDGFRSCLSHRTFSVSEYFHVLFLFSGRFPGLLCASWPPFYSFYSVSRIWISRSQQDSALFHQGLLSCLPCLTWLLRCPWAVSQLWRLGFRVLGWFEDPNLDLSFFLDFPCFPFNNYKRRIIYYQGRLFWFASTWVYLGLLGSTWVNLGLLSSTWVYLGLLGSTCVYLGLLGSTWVNLGLLGST